MYALKTKLADKANYGGARKASDIKYIVIHYTANDGDTDEGNGNYFANNVVKASAHYFVDDNSVTRSVPDLSIAYAVGGKKWTDCAKTGGGKLYGKVTNKNSLSIELCDTRKDGKLMATEATLANAAALCKELMEKYNVDINHVVRHFDVNGKHCPVYFMQEAPWLAFKARVGKVTPPTVKAESGAYRVKVTAFALNVRRGPGTGYNIVTTIKDKGVYTITEEKNGWGRLKSGMGWISLKYTKRVEPTTKSAWI